MVLHLGNKLSLSRKIVVSIMADDVLVEKLFNFICGSGGYVPLPVLLRHSSPLGSRKTEIEARNWLKNQTEFVLVKDGDGRIMGVRIDLKKKLCSQYVSKGSCRKRKGICKHWHICRTFVEGNCDGVCGLSHDFHNEANGEMTRELGLEKYSNGSLKNIVAWSLPRVCESYLRNECMSDKCPHIHVCSKVVRGSSCSCFLSHNLTDFHNMRILKNYDLVPQGRVVNTDFVRCSILILGEERFACKLNSFMEGDKGVTSKAATATVTSNMPTAATVTGRTSTANDAMGTATTFEPSEMKVFDCLCKEYQCSATFSVLTKRTDLFPRNFDKVEEWFRKKKGNFLITENVNGVISQVDAYSVKARLCLGYNRYSRGGCKRENCSYLHVCREYITDSCITGVTCSRNHHFQDKREKALLSRVKLDHLTDEQLCQLVLSSTPQVCSEYNRGVCQRVHSCKRVHVCSDHLKRSCSEGSVCDLDHESAMHSLHTRAILERYHLEDLSDFLVKRIILVCDDSTKNKETGHIRQDKPGEPICSDFLLGKCAQRSVVTKENSGGARKPRFDNEIGNYPGNAHTESIKKRIKTSRDTRGVTSIVNTPVKVSQTYKQTMKTTECLAPDGLIMRGHANTEAARTSMMDSGCSLQAPPSSPDMRAGHHRELSVSNSCRPASVTSCVPLKVKVFECLCKEYNCSVSFEMISKRTDLFPCGFKDIGSWFKRNRTDSFLITEDEQGVISEVDAYSFHARLCFNYNSVYHGSCKKKNCQYLHVCKDYITNSCSHGAICQRNHHFQDERDKALLSKVKLDELTDEQLRKLVLSSTPQVCVKYNNSICDRGNSCKSIHICSNHLNKSCREENSCGLDHESAMHTGHTQSVLNRYHLEHLGSRPLKKIILVPDCSPAKKETGHHDQNDQDVHICSDFPLGVCEKGFQCRAHHCPLPFHWQYRLTEDNEWKSFSGEDNEKLEKLFCDVTQNDCSAAGFHISCERGESILLKEVHEVRFLLDRMVMVLEDESEIIADLRRLSTDSYVANPGSAMATRWIWYWKEGDEIWRVYDQDDGAKDLQRSLEEAFLKSRNRFRFRLAGQDYALSFFPTFEMSESSLKYGTARKVRRRPEKMLSKDDINELKRSHIFLPLCWRNKTRRAIMPRNWSAVPSDRQYKRIPLPQHSAEFREMEKVFSKSIKCSVVITNIEKLQVPIMWKKYQRRKGKMSVVKAGSSKRKFLTEEQLTHGTRPRVAKTCEQSVKWCVACKYVCTFSRKEHQRVRRRKLLRLDFLSE